jgi:hypothetical protein
MFVSRTCEYLLFPGFECAITLNDVAEQASQLQLITWEIFGRKGEKIFGNEGGKMIRNWDANSDRKVHKKVRIKWNWIIIKKRGVDRNL